MGGTTEHSSALNDVEMDAVNGTETHDMELEDKQPSCKMCGSFGWGLLYPCNICNNWYHDDCHDFKHRNPYAE